jgi:hypothetical protein
MQLLSRKTPGRDLSFSLDTNTVIALQATSRSPTNCDALHAKPYCGTRGIFREWINSSRDSWWSSMEGA